MPAANQSGTLTPQGWLQWIAVIAIAGAMGLGGALALPQLAPQAARPDPFTGREGDELEARVMAEIRRIDHEGSRMTQACQARVAALEARNAEMVQRLQRIEELLIELRVRVGRQPYPPQVEGGRMSG